MKKNENTSELIKNIDELMEKESLVYIARNTDTKNFIKEFLPSVELINQRIKNARNGQSDIDDLTFDIVDDEVIDRGNQQNIDVQPEIHGKYLYRQLNQYLDILNAREIMYGLDLGGKRMIAPLLSHTIKHFYGVVDDEVNGNPVRRSAHTDVAFESIVSNYEALTKKKTLSKTEKTEFECTEKLFDVVDPLFKHTTQQILYRLKDELPMPEMDIETGKALNTKIGVKEFLALKNHAEIFTEISTEEYEGTESSPALLDAVCACQDDAVYDHIIAKNTAIPKNDLSSVQNDLKMFIGGRTFTGYSGALNDNYVLNGTFRNSTIQNLIREIDEGSSFKDISSDLTDDLTDDWRDDDWDDLDDE